HFVALGSLERAARRSAGVLCCLLAAECGREEKGDVRPAPEDTLVMQVGGPLSRRPQAPLRIEGACPFECCTYGTWTTTATTTVYEQPDESAASFTVPAGAALEASSGYVLLTRIGVAVAQDTVRVFDESGQSRLMAAGETLLVLDDVGEGYRRVWHAGAIYQTDAASGVDVGPGAPAAELVVEPERQWWVRVRTEDGRTGWLWMDRTPQMEGADACS
ncbi:MAG: hypothetical protein ACREK2_10715, partial [Gemmatimonadota bacterium]